MRGDDSQCGNNRLKDFLVIASFVYSLLALSAWSVSVVLWRRGFKKTDK